MQLSQKQIQHLFLRAGFGASPSYIYTLVGKTKETIVEQLFSDSASFKDLSYLPFPLSEKEEQKGIGGFQLVALILRSKKEMEELNSEWIFKMAYTKARLREKMTFFWHNHFACSAPFAYLMQKQNNLLRKHALGKFPDMLHAMAKDPAMIIYLNNQENKKAHPNENFARELMELFTLGEGHYTEKDIKESARAFTGWAVNNKGQFEFRKNVHDDDEKEFFGRKGNFNGEEIINIILEKKQCAVYIVTKIYREFVNPEINSNRIEELAESFFKSGYDTGQLMKNIFSSDWFYDEENMGCKIASPVELLVRYKLLTNLDFKKVKTQTGLQNVLGQVLFFPPNVAGWKGGRAWIDSSSLLLRLNLPQYIINESEVDLGGKPAFEEEDYQPKEKTKLYADWKEIISHNKPLQRDAMYDVLITQLIQCNSSQIKKEIVMQNVSTQDKEKYIVKLAANIMSTPEFQLI